MCPNTISSLIPGEAFKKILKTDISKKYEYFLQKTLRKASRLLLDIPNREEASIAEGYMMDIADVIENLEKEETVVIRFQYLKV